MTLATHAIAGGAVATLFPGHPIMAFLAGFFSHFVLDAIPHWQYRLLSAYANPNAVTIGSKKAKADKYFVFDLARIGADALLGILIILFVWHPSGVVQLQILALGMIGGMLPDFLQFVYARFSHQPMILIQKFHIFIHSEYNLDDRPVIGVFSQIAIVVLVILLAKYLMYF